jgi:poly(hydroxyalkanoate) depolymerase family esterase
MKPARIVLALSAAAASSLCLASTTKTTTTITSSLNPSTYGQAVTFTAMVTPAPPNGEIITFMEGKVELGTSALSGGSASLTISTLTTGGEDPVDAVYGGDSIYGGSTSKAVEQVVDQAPTTTTLGSSQNPSNVGAPVTLTATVTSEFGVAVNGSVAFYNGTTKLKTVTISGDSAAYTTTTLALGMDSITASYTGNNSFLTSTSAAVNQSVEQGTFTSSTLAFDGVTRYYQVYVPAVLPNNPPLLLMLHGTSYDVPPANPSTLNWGWQSVANEYGFIVVQPASTLNSNTGQWNWNSYFMDAAFTPSDIGTCTSPPATACPDDAGFLRQLILNLTSQYNVNANMVFVTGFSSGAQMTERVGVEISDLVAAIAPTSGQMEGQQSEPPPVLVPGDEVAPISVQEWHGTEDTELPPCNYGTTKYSGVTFYLDTVDDTFNYWVQQNQCSTLQTTQTLCTNDAPTPGLSGNVATGCQSSNVEVQFIWEQDTGHAWISSNDTARWLFLSAHAKSSGDNVRSR